MPLTKSDIYLDAIKRIIDSSTEDETIVIAKTALELAKQADDPTGASSAMKGKIAEQVGYICRAIRNISSGYGIGAAQDEAHKINVIINENI